MSGPSGQKHRNRLPANDNRRGRRPMRAELRFPPVLPVQWIEVEVFARLLESVAVAANDNEEGDI